MNAHKTRTVFGEVSSKRRVALAFKILKATGTVAQRLADYDELVAAYRADGHTPAYCIHGTYLWVDWDCVCGLCEDGIEFGVLIRREALAEADRRIKFLDQAVYEYGSALIFLGKYEDRLDPWGPEFGRCQEAREVMRRGFEEICQAYGMPGSVK